MNLNSIKNGLLGAARKGMQVLEEKVAPSVSGFVENARETTQEKIIPGIQRGAKNVQNSIEESDRRRRMEKEAYELLSSMHSCNDCADRKKECCPQWGEPARYNCFWWTKEENSTEAEKLGNIYSPEPDLPMSNRRRNLK